MRGPTPGEAARRARGLPPRATARGGKTDEVLVVLSAGPGAGASRLFFPDGLLGTQRGPAHGTQSPGAGDPGASDADQRADHGAGAGARAGARSQDACPKPVRAARACRAATVIVAAQL